ncbi:MAG: hypothetical protein WD185_10180 [Sneathiella sp.]
MGNYTKIVFAATAMTIGLSAAATSTHAVTSGSSEYVENVDISFRSGTVYLDVKNVSGSKLVSQVSLQPQTTELSIPASGYAKCSHNKKVDFDSAKIYFGGLGMGGLDNINSSGTLHESNYSIANATWNGQFNGGWITESDGGDQFFKVPVNKIKIGHPALRVDPVEILNAKLQAHLNGGGTKLDFFRHDQEVAVPRPVSIAAWCEKDGLRKAGFETRTTNIVVRYKGDPQLAGGPVLNAQLGQGPQQIATGLPFQITHATFQPNLPNYVGKCAPKNDPVIRVNFKGTGEGSMLLKIDDGGNTVPTTPITLFNSEDQYERHVDLAYPLKLRLVQNASWNTLNQTFSHPLTIKVRVKNKGSNNWGPWKDFASVTWKHRCVPQVSIGAGAINNGGYQSQGNAARPATIGTVKVPVLQPAPKPARAAD